MTIKKRYIRLTAWACALVAIYFLFLQWQIDFGDTTQNQDIEQKASNGSELQEISPHQIRVQTDVLDIIIDRKGGDMVSAKLLDYRKNLKTSESVQLLSSNEERFYVIRSGLSGKQGPDSGTNRPLYNADQQSYSLENGEKELKLELTHTTESGVKITKEFIFRAGDYLIDVNYRIKNESNETFSSRFFGQIVRTDFTLDDSFDGVGVKSYLGAALTTPETAYEKVDFDDMRDADLNVEVKGGWIAMIQHYFVSAWIPSEHETYSYQTRTAKGNKFLLGFVAKEFDLAVDADKEINSSVYIGPKILDRLKGIAPNLDLTIDFGWLWFIAIPLFYILDFVQSIVSNWGLSIILLTCTVKLVFFYPSHLSYSSMARMRKVAPQMKSIKESYSHDKQKLQQEMMALYKREKVNPLGGCLPILIQMPVFIALYWMLLESVELRHAPFILWIEDLSALDPFFIMPLIMGGTMFAQQLLSPTPPDPTQAKIMRLMPIVFTFLFLWFPAGLVLYWITNNSLSILQQWYITRSITAKTQ